MIANESPLGTLWRGYKDGFKGYYSNLKSGIKKLFTDPMSIVRQEMNLSFGQRLERGITGALDMLIPGFETNMKTQAATNRAIALGDIYQVGHIHGNQGGKISFEVGTVFGPGILGKGLGRLGRAIKASAPTGKFYSVAFEMVLNSKSYPGVSRYLHFKEANIALDNAMKSNPLLRKLGISVPRSAAGSISGKSPVGWVWHHNVKTGLMQLVPKVQHPSIPSGIFWDTMHPGGVGGYSIWGN